MEPEVGGLEVGLELLGLYWERAFAAAAFAFA